MKKEKGMTLLEVILVLIIVGILSAMAGLGLVRAMQGYLFAKENAPLTQKAQLAMSRMTREFMEISIIPVNATSTRLTFTNTFGTKTLALVGSNIRLIDGTSPPTATTGDILVDNVAAFALTYNGAAGWLEANDLRDLKVIGIRLTLRRLDPIGGNLIFYVEVNPRNNATFNAPVI